MELLEMFEEEEVITSISMLLWLTLVLMLRLM